MRKPVIFLVTVDGDLRVGDVEQQKRSVRRLFGLFDELGLRGCVTWFVNETDFHWTTLHGDLLLEIVERGEAVGIHDHFDTHYATTYEKALPLAKEALRKLTTFYAGQGKRVHLISHRNGCFWQTQTLYQVIRELGYRVVSDVWPGTRSATRMLKIQDSPQRWLAAEDDAVFLRDHTAVPLAGNLWWHDENNWLQYDSTQGALLQVPVISAPYIELDRMQQAAAAAAGAAAYLTWDTHPYNILDEATGEVDENMLSNFRANLSEIRARLDPVWMNMERLWCDACARLSLATDARGGRP